MSRLAQLPRIMVAPNGARRGKSDHPALPINIDEIVAEALACFEAGADALHAHVRDDNGVHVLDAVLYAELLEEMRLKVPQMPVQITTEAVGRYTPTQQRELVRAIKAEGVSVALREMWPDEGRDPDAIRFYAEAAEADIAVQHILYSPDDVARLVRLAQDGWLVGPQRVLFVLGRYAPPVDAQARDLATYVAALALLPDTQWAACAFGRDEQQCLLAAVAAGGAMRIGFENNILDVKGNPAKSNAAQVAALVSAIEGQSVARKNS